LNIIPARQQKQTSLNHQETDFLCVSRSSKARINIYIYGALANLMSAKNTEQRVACNGSMNFITRRQEKGKGRELKLSAPLFAAHLNVQLPRCD